MSKGCESGCKAFSGGEIKHHKDCIHYPESLSKIYDDLKKELKMKKSEITYLICMMHGSKYTGFYKKELDKKYTILGWGL